MLDALTVNVCATWSLLSTEIVEPDATLKQTDRVERSALHRERARDHRGLVRSAAAA